MRIEERDVPRDLPRAFQANQEVQIAGRGPFALRGWLNTRRDDAIVDARPLTARAPAIVVTVANETAAAAASNSFVEKDFIRGLPFRIPQRGGCPLLGLASGKGTAPRPNGTSAKWVIGVDRTGYVLGAGSFAKSASNVWRLVVLEAAEVADDPLAVLEVSVAEGHYDRVMADEKQAGFIAGGPRRARNGGEGFLAFLRDWIASLFRVDRRM